MRSRAERYGFFSPYNKRQRKNRKMKMSQLLSAPIPRFNFLCFFHIEPEIFFSVWNPLTGDGLAIDQHASLFFSLIFCLPVFSAKSLGVRINRWLLRKGL